MTETLNGEYEVTLVHPIDEAGKWTRLTENAILRVPVPAAMTPYVRLPDNRIELDVSSRGVWRLTQKCGVRIAPGTNYKILENYYGGTRVAVLGTSYVVTVTNTSTGTSMTSILSSLPSGSPESGTTRTVAYWYKVAVANGVTGYIPSYCASNVYHSTEIETVVGDVVESRQLREQPFRIYRVVPELGQVTVYARHIFYDLLDNMVKGYRPAASDRGAEAVKGIGAACLSPTEFSFYSDLTGMSDDFEVINKNPVDAYLGDAGLIEKYGGELARDWYDVYIVDHVGSDTNIEIREGKNLSAVMYDVNTTDVVTRIMPTGETSDGKTLYLPETYIDSSHIGDYPHPKWIQLAVSDAKIGSGCTQQQVYTKLREAAQAEFDNGCDMPSATLTVDFVNLYDTEEYRNYGFLQNIYLGDSVRVISKRLGLSVSMRMTQYTYDCLLKKYTLMTLGTVADTLATNMITARQLPTGIVNGSKLAINSVGTGALQDGAVKTANIDIAAIGTAHIQDAAISTAKIADASITSGKIADAAITNAKIGSAAIESANIADAAITEAKIQSAAVTTAKISDAAVTKAKIANLAVDSAKIDDLAVTTAKLANAAITNAKIANAAVDTAQIALGAITAALIQNGAIGTAQIADASITEGKIVSLNADVIRSGTLATERLIITGNDGLIYEINAEASGLTLAELSDAKYKSQLNGSVIVARSITADRIAAAAITANEILAGTITGDKIAASTIEGSNIKAGAITTSHLSANFGEVLDLSSNTGINLLVSGLNDDIDDLQGNIAQAVINASTAQATADDAQERARTNTHSIQRMEGSVSGLSTQLNVFTSGIEATIESHDEVLSAMSFDSSGLKVQMAGSIYSTLTDDVGYHILQNDKEIASFSEGKGKMDQLQMGTIVARKTSKGGWVWTDA